MTSTRSDVSMRLAPPSPVLSPKASAETGYKKRDPMTSIEEEQGEAPQEESDVSVSIPPRHLQRRRLSFQPSGMPRRKSQVLEAAFTVARRISGVVETKPVVPRVMVTPPTPCVSSDEEEFFDKWKPNL